MNEWERMVEAERIAKAINLRQSITMKIGADPWALVNSGIRRGWLTVPGRERPERASGVRYPMRDE